MNNVDTFNDFRKSIRLWTDEDYQQGFTKAILNIFLPAKEILYGVQFSEMTKKQVARCITSRERVQELWEKQSRPNDASQIAEDLKAQWLFSSILDCARETTKQLPPNPKATQPIPLNDKTIWRHWNDESSVLYFFNDHCVPCHMSLSKKMCAAKFYSPNVYTVSKDAWSLFDQEMTRQVVATPSLFYCERNFCNPIPYQEFLSLMENRCQEAVKQ